MVWWCAVLPMLHLWLYPGVLVGLRALVLLAILALVPLGVLALWRSRVLGGLGALA